MGCYSIRVIKEDDFNMLYTVYMPWLARALQRQGFKIIRITESKNKPGFSVYQFVDSPELQAAIDNILQNRKHR